jgi:hypothetical protein
MTDELIFTLTRYLGALLLAVIVIHYLGRLTARGQGNGLSNQRPA